MRKSKSGVRRVNELIIPIIGGMFLALAALIGYLGTRGKTRSDAKQSMDARIDERVGEELERLYARIGALEAELGSIRKRLNEAEKTMDLSERQAVEMIGHIVTLEGLIPNPPGPPQRPNWKLPLLNR